jgi:crotonobetainyl-CoA:carnitine CoA-transferase CaiB-like acyl-CoA transferase
MINQLPPDPPDFDEFADEPTIFDDIRIIDFTSGIAGPYATMFLADHGADVIKIEPPGGDPYRVSPGFETFNRGKRSVMLDPTSDSGRNRTQLLARAADVVVVDIPTARAAEHGIDEASLRKSNPSLVYIAMPPFGERGPFVNRPSSPALIAAVSGIMADQASYSGDPTYLVLPLASYGSAAIGAAAIAAGLYSRERWGVGQRLDVSQLAGAAALQIGGVLSDQLPVPPGGPSPSGSKGRLPVYRLFQAGDGLWFFVACGTPDFFNRLLIAIGQPELAGDPRVEDAPWGLISDQSRDLLAPLLEQAFRSQDRDYWLGRLQEYDVPAQPVQTRDEYFDSHTVAANDMRINLEHPDYGCVEMMGIPLNLTAAPGRARLRAPKLDEHTDEVLAEVAAARLPVGRIASREPGPHLLQGVRVLDVSSFIAGPTLPRHLAMLGADVIKVEPPTGDPFRQIGLGFLGWNQGKRSISLNLRMPQGQAVFHRLATDADVIVENYRPGVTRRLGVDHATLRDFNPRLIYVTAPGWGHDETMAGQPGWDPLVQARSGAMHHQGSDSEPVFYSIPLNDVMTPAIGLFGVLAGLFYRERTAQGQLVELALARTGLAIQAAEFTRIEGAPAGGGFLRGDIDFPGPDAGQRWYRCADREPLFVEATSQHERATLISTVGVALQSAQLAAPYGQPACTAATESLFTAFAMRTRDEWIEALDQAGVPCAPIYRRSEALCLPHLTENGLVVQQPHPQWGTTTNYGLLIQPSVTIGRLNRSAPTRSQDATKVLAEAGYDATEIAALAESGAVVLPD